MDYLVGFLWFIVVDMIGEVPDGFFWILISTNSGTHQRPKAE
jgi:hypothetical protein